jgi:beta-galactosidase
VREKRRNTPSQLHANEVEAIVSTRTPSPVTGLGLDVDGLVFGCDYNPEQWDRAVWLEDVRLMTEAGVNLVAINVFGWSKVERRAGEFDFADLDEIIGLLTEAGIGVNLGTGTSSPPPWVTTAHPEILPMGADGTRRWPGGRQAWCPSSPVFRELALKLVAVTAERYGSHPNVKLWHVSNELGCHNAHCYCDVSAAAFREWLVDHYGSVEAVNSAWGTTFWSQHYAEWDEILPPRLTLSISNSAQVLDFDRFSSDELLSYYRAEAETIRLYSDLPITTNFMVTAHIRSQDYWQWAPEMDVIANDHYLDYRLPLPERELSFAADATRGLAGGRPWLLMESSTSAVNWQPVNHAKTPGQLLRNSLTHVARGADGVCFFQWRASAQGSEKFHSALLPHAGTESRIWNEVLELGSVLQRISEIAGSTVHSDIAVLFSWESWWAADLDSHPSSELRYIEQVHAMYEALLEIGATVDIVRPGDNLDKYRMVVVPHLYLVSHEAAAVVNDFVNAGGHAVVTFFSGIVDENDRVRLGGYPGAFRNMLGVVSEEFYPLAPGETLLLSDGSSASLWSEQLRLTTATPVAEYADATLEGVPAVTRNDFGDGVGWYVASKLSTAALAALLRRVVVEAGAVALADTRSGVEIVRRRGDKRDYVFVLNHTNESVDHCFEGQELISGEVVTTIATIEPGGVHVIRQERGAQ